MEDEVSWPGPPGSSALGLIGFPETDGCYPLLDSRGHVAIQVANVGKAGVPALKWGQKGPEAVNLIVEVEHRKYGVTLPLLDPERHLAQPGGKVTYIFDKLIITESTRVVATIDPTDKVAEGNERNNRVVEALEPRRERMKR